MKQYDYLNGWWHLLPNLCLLTAIIGQFNPIALNSLTWGRISIAPRPARQMPEYIRAKLSQVAPKAIKETSNPTFSVTPPAQLISPVQQPAI